MGEGEGLSEGMRWFRRAGGEYERNAGLETRGPVIRGAQLEPGPGDCTQIEERCGVLLWFVSGCGPALTPLSPEPPVFRVSFYFVTKISAS